MLYICYSWGTATGAIQTKREKKKTGLDINRWAKEKFILNRLTNVIIFMYPYAPITYPPFDFFSFFLAPLLIVYASVLIWKSVWLHPGLYQHRHWHSLSMLFFFFECLVIKTFSFIIIVMIICINCVPKKFTSAL